MSYPIGPMLRHSAIAACSSFPSQIHHIFFQDHYGAIRYTSPGGGVSDIGMVNDAEAKWHTPLASVCLGADRIVLFYLDDQDLVQAASCNSASGPWERSSVFRDGFFQAAPFSNLAAVATGTSSIRVFYQGIGNGVQEIKYQFDVSADEGGSTTPAVTGTGLAACFFPGTQEMSVFYQDATATVRQRVRRAGGTWTAGALQASNTPLQCGISVVAHSGLTWKTDVIRLHIIDFGNRSVSWSYLANRGTSAWDGWPRYLHAQDALDHSRIAAIVFPQNDVEQVRVFYQGQGNQMLSYGITNTWQSLGQIPTE